MNQNKTIDGEQAFPIYYIFSKWSQDDKRNSKYPEHSKGLPEGRIWNRINGLFMFKEEQTVKELEA